MHARIEQTIFLDVPVQQVRFAHGKRLEGLHELGIKTVRDLIDHYPFRYDDFSQTCKIIDLPLGKKKAVLGTIHEAQTRRTAKGKALFEITLTDGTGTLKAVWFNQRWLAEILVAGKDIMLLGTAEHYKGLLSMSSPLYTLIDNPKAQDISEESDHELKSIDAGVSPVGIVPVYRANSAVSTNWIKRLIIEARKKTPEPLDPLPPTLRAKRRLISRQIAWQGIHAPKNHEELSAARYRLAYEQVFWLQLGMSYTESKQWKGFSSFEHQIIDRTMDELVDILPFVLTPSQQSAVKEILDDLQTPTRMNRLLLGDVGSGKTVVALHALVVAAGNGWQAAMMAPTEVLAQQYAASVGSYLDRLGISWALLTSSLSTADREAARTALALGKTSVVFGTHALLEPEVSFKMLSLIVIDEQQRFGVEQRKELRKKSPAADFLSMTATPIPRSLALVMFGNIEVSYLENRPNKVQVITKNFKSSLDYKAYEAVRQAIGRGEQAYIVCPLISASPPDDQADIPYLDSLSDFVDEPYIAAAEAELIHLRTQVFPEHRVELITSRVKSEDKLRIMSEFKAGKIDILVSTTVIEVGVDAPNATVMVVLDADRFGLAQLHQLRGRVGRGKKDSQMILVSQNPGEQARKRLRLLEQYSDGLTLAEADLLERREGDLAGTRQHGAGSLSLVNVIRDKTLISAAHADVQKLLKEDPELSLTKNVFLRYEMQQKESMCMS